MTRALLISDTHGNLDIINKLVEKTNVDMVIHAGDFGFYNESSYNIMVDGKRVHRVLGKESEGVTRQQAEEFIAKMRTDARHDRLNLPKGRKLTLSFEEAAEKYLEKLQEEGGKNISKKREQLKLHLIPFFKEKPLSQSAPLILNDIKNIV